VHLCGELRLETSETLLHPGLGLRQLLLPVLGELRVDESPDDLTVLHDRPDGSLDRQPDVPVPGPQVQPGQTHDEGHGEAEDDPSRLTPGMFFEPQKGFHGEIVHRLEDSLQQKGGLEPIRE